MKSTLKQSLIKHGLLILGFIILTVIIYYPFFLDGKQISQHDVLQGYGATQHLKEFRESTGEEGLWMNSMFSGMPAFLNGVQFSGDILEHVYDFLKLGMPHPEGITLVCFVSFYLLLLAFGVRPWIAFAGAVAFGLNGFNMIGIMAGHNAKIAAVAFMPAVLAGIHLAFSGKRALGTGLTALALALQIRMNHPQITYYLLLMAIVYGSYTLFYAIKDKKIKPLSISLASLILAASVAIAANAGKLWTTLEYSNYSTRGKSELAADASQSAGLDEAYVFRFSNGIFEPLFLFIPNFYGGSSQQELGEKSATAKALRQAGMNGAQVSQQIQAMPTYWGDQPLTAPYYAGSIVVFLFVAGLFFLPGKEKWWMVTAAALGIILSWGHNFSALNTLLFDYLPGYNKFRSVTFTIIITILSMNLLGFMALEKIWQSKWDKTLLQQLFRPLAVTGGFALLMIIGAGMLSYRGAIDERLPEWLIGALREDRASLLRSDAFRALFFILAFSAMVWAAIRQKLTANLAVSGLILLVVLDVFTLSRRFVDPDSFENNPAKNYFRPSEADLAITQQAQPGERVLNLQNPFNDGHTSYLHESIGGYHGAKMRRYQDLIDQCLGNELTRLISDLQANKRNFANLSTLNMLNARYFMAGSSKNAVLVNANALGNAWLVNEIEPVNSADEELAAVCDFQPQDVAIIDVSRFEQPTVDRNARGNIELVNRTPNELTYKAEVTGNTLAVFSEIYYPRGWKATVDGEPVEILRANYVLRALPLSEGLHEIGFSFEPKSYSLGSTISLIGNILVVLIFLGGVWMEIKK